MSSPSQHGRHCIRLLLPSVLYCSCCPSFFLDRAVEEAVEGERPSASLIQSTSPSTTNFLWNLPKRPATSLSSIAPSPVSAETFHSG